MKIRLIAPICLALASFGALADEGSDAPPSRFRPFIGAGYTLGGNTIMAVTIVPTSSSGSSSGKQYEEDISAGAGLDLRAGVDYRLSSAVSVQAAVAYHNDQTNGTSGTISFRRVPIELIAYWHASERWRVGLGARKGTNVVFDYSPKQAADGSALDSFKVEMKMTTGIILEAERYVTPNWTLKFRYVKETVSVKDYPDEKYKGDHVGLITAYYFD